MSTNTFRQWLSWEWYWRVRRHFEHDRIIMKIAWMLPRKLALWCFIRVYSCTGEAPGEEYIRAYDAWEKGAGR